MIGLSSLLPPGVMETLGWALLHFLWQGLALAVLLYTCLAFTRSAVVRYWGAVCTLALMSLAPIVTFVVLRQNNTPPATAASLREALADVSGIASATLGTPVAAATHSVLSIDWAACFVGVWLAGVLVLSVRALGGWMLVRRMYREERQKLAPVLAARCLALQRHLGISRAVSYFESQAIEAPAVIGWFRPIVLLPVTALTGLSADQLEAIIVHELAHIRRYDGLVNLFQIAAETVLFYHPAIWWINRVIRAERENCCDDIAVNMCGDAGSYARALTLMEGLRGARHWRWQRTAAV